MPDGDSGSSQQPPASARPDALPDASARSTVSGKRRGVVAVVIREERFLVIRRSQHVAAPGKFCFPGGHIEPGETEEEALVREMQEELASAVRPLARIWQSTTAWNLDLAWWSAELLDPTQLVPNPHEVESVHWFTHDELARRNDLLSSNVEFLQWRSIRGEAVK